MGATWDTHNLCWLHYRLDNNKFYEANKYVLYLKSCPRKGTFTNILRVSLDRVKFGLSMEIEYMSSKVGHE